jgi:transposase-like protein
VTILKRSTLTKHCKYCPYCKSSPLIEQNSFGVQRERFLCEQCNTLFEVQDINYTRKEPEEEEIDLKGLRIRNISR